MNELFLQESEQSSQTKIREVEEEVRVLNDQLQVQEQVKQVCMVGNCDVTCVLWCSQQHDGETEQNMQQVKQCDTAG